MLKEINTKRKTIQLKHKKNTDENDDDDDDGDDVVDDIKNHLKVMFESLSMSVCLCDVGECILLLC